MNARSISAVVLAAGLLLVGCGEQNAGPLVTNSVRPRPQSNAGPPDCGIIDGASDDYGTEIHPTSGTPGSKVILSGTTVRGEDGKWAPSDRLEAWWNTDAPASEVPGGTPVKDGPIFRLVRVDDMERCRFEASFSVPDVEPGRYKISIFAWEADPSQGYGLFLPHHFTVSAPQFHLPPCDNNRSFGETIPGTWLEDVIVNLGAPGGIEVTEDEVKDTGTALWIDIVESSNDPTIFATILTPDDDSNMTAPAPLPEEKIEKRGPYSLSFQRGEPWEIYKAVSDEWQLSLIAYPGADSHQIAWPDGTVEWVRRAADRAQESPPQCSGQLN